MLRNQHIKRIRTMGAIGYTYGSEWHLLRLLGYHREHLNKAVEGAIPGAQVTRWLDFDFRADNNPPDPGCRPACPEIPERRRRPRRLDREYRAIDFLSREQLAKVEEAWGDYWPQTGTPPNWDAVAEIEIAGELHWLLVEAKSHPAELASSCRAGEEARGLIQAAFQTTQAGWNIACVDKWLNCYYQFCNRLAVLHFLQANNIRAKLLFIYFLNDLHSEGGPRCPATEEEWREAIGEMEEHVGWDNADNQNHLAPHVHKLFLPVGLL